MKKAKTLWIGIMLSLVLAISGMAGVTAQLHTVYADEDQAEITVTCTFGTISDKAGYTIKAIYLKADKSKTISRTDSTISKDEEVIVVYKPIDADDTSSDDSETYEEYNSPDVTPEYEEGNPVVEATEAPVEDTAVQENPNGEDADEDTTESSDDAVDTESVDSPQEEDGDVSNDASVTPAENMASTDVEEGEASTEKEAEAAEAAEADEAEVAPTGETEEAEEAKEDDSLQKEGETVTVTFDVQGHGTAPESKKVESGKTVEKPADPAAEGYVFEGWFADQACTTAFNFDEAVTKDVTIYAKWTQTFTVSFTTERGTAPAAQTVKSGDKATQPTVTATGYTLTGWQLNGSAYDFSAAVTSDLTLTAVWRANTYTIHFDANDSTYGKATGSTANVSCTYDTEATLTKNGFTRGTDWEFTGWNTAANGSGTAYADQAKVKNLTAEDGATVTLYAQWKFIYKMVAGANASVSKLDTRGLTFQTNGFYSLFTGVAVDGTILNASNYTTSAANYGTYITLKQDYIKTLSIGQHRIQFLYSDGSVSTTFNVNNSTVLNPVQTGDNSHMALWVAVLAGAAAAAIGFVLLRRRYNR